ncbi:hypothetical protein HRD57_09540 [Tetragenococcus halophilus]|nr:hypothetical protein [Tetragenococcus halophilus]
MSGSGNNLYQVIITIDPIADQRLEEQINYHVESLEDLAYGKFPKALEKVFLTSENGTLSKDE